MRFAVIGAGIIGSLHAQTIQQSEGAELVGVMGPVRDNAVRAAEGSSAEITAELGDVLELDPEAVVVPSPVHYHEEAVTAALERGATRAVEIAAALRRSSETGEPVASTPTPPSDA